MAVLRVPATDRRLTDPTEISAFLAAYGMIYERWDVEGRIGGDAGDDQILAAYDPEITALKRRGGYVTADVINVTPETPNLDAMLDRFNKEHRHTEDEVRFIVRGRGLFHIHPEGDPVFAIEVSGGDLITVPAGMRHWFDLCEERTIRAIRLFLDKSGWTPLYVEESVHADYAPLCWGPAFIPSVAVPERTVRI